MEISNSCIYLGDKALSSYIYVKNYQQINLDKKELEKDFLSTVLSTETVVSLSDLYLSLLKNSELEKFQKLQHDERFDLDVVINSLCKDLCEDYQKYGVVFFLQDKKAEKEYLRTNPLKEIIDKPYMQDFFDGLNLSYSEKILFVLAIANEEWGWLFPDFKNEEYKAHLFCHICGIDKRDEIGYSRKINNTLIKLGLFSGPWKINTFVYSYFKNETPSFTLQNIKPLKWCDYYDYKTVGELNTKDLEIMRKLKGFMIINSQSDYRNKYFLAHYFNECSTTLYELKPEYSVTSKCELEFYIYVLSLKFKDSPLFINNSLVSQLITDNSDNSLEEMFRKMKRSSSILEKVQSPVILSMESFTDEDRSSFLAQGIDILYTMKLNLPQEKLYQDNFIHFCCEQKLPLKFLNVIALECEKLEIESEQWQDITKLFKQVTNLTQEEALTLLKNKYAGSNKSDKLRKNSNYCIEALNTSEPINEVIEALKNADEYQKGEYDEESGIKVLLYGISGGGKTAYAEEVSRKMNRSLKIVRPCEVLSKWVGETEQNISRIFKDAAKDHSILLVDEADSFLHNRGDSVNHFEDSKVNSFLIEIERYPGILFCSTNLPDILDKALDRRFNFKIGFKPLTKEGIALLCKSYFSSFDFDEDQILKIYNSGDVTPGDFAALNGKLRFLAPEKRNAQDITETLCKIIRDKKRSYETNKIGFGV